MKATRIIKKLFSQKSRKHLSEEGAESRIDYLSDHLGIVKEEVIRIVHLQLAMQLSYKDVWLDYFLSCQNLILPLTSGDFLSVDGEYCHDAKGEPVLRFSKKFKQEIEAMKQKGYMAKTAKIRFIVYWQKEGSEYEIRIVLPELYFERTV